MIRIVRASTLADLRDAADRYLRHAEGAGQAAADSRRDAEDARRIAENWKSFAAGAEDARKRAEAARAEAEAKYDAVTADTAAALVRLWDLADTSPEGLEAVQAGIALRILRTRIAEIKAAGDPEPIDGIRVLDAVIGADGRHAAAEALRALGNAEGVPGAEG